MPSPVGNAQTSISEFWEQWPRWCRPGFSAGEDESLAQVLQLVSTALTLALPDLEVPAHPPLPIPLPRASSACRLGPLAGAERGPEAKSQTRSRGHVTWCVPLGTVLPKWTRVMASADSDRALGLARATGCGHCGPAVIVSSSSG